MVVGAALLAAGFKSCAADTMVKLPSTPTTGPATRADAVFRTPQETVRSIKVPAGYHLEVVASEPVLDTPVTIAWDGNGRMYVAEMRSYMRDVDDTKWNEPISQVLRLEDTKGDGHYDKTTVFADKLLLPRMVLPLDERVLIRETDTKDIKCYRDTKGDGVADEKTLFYKGGGRGANLEHQPSGLIWNLDNWIYDTGDGTRFRFTRGKLETEPVYSRFAQWGLGRTTWERCIIRRPVLSSRPSIFSSRLFTERSRCLGSWLKGSPTAGRSATCRTWKGGQGGCGLM